MKYLAVFILAWFLLIPNIFAADLEMGQIPDQVELSGDVGGRLDGEAWSSNELKGKVHVLLYVDPDVKDLNNDATEALAKENFPPEKYASVAVINYAATWLPNFILSSSLEEKQKKYPNTLYVRDYGKTLVKAWSLSDDNNDVVVFDKKGRMIFRKDGKLDEKDIAEMLKVIKANL